VNSRSRSLYAIARPSVVCNVCTLLSRLKFSAIYFYVVWYIGFPTEGFPWDNLRQIFSEGQWMAKVPNGKKQKKQQKKSNAQVWGGLLKQRQRLVCCERHVQNVTNFIAHKPVKKLNAEILYNFIS